MLFRSHDTPVIVATTLSSHPNAKDIGPGISSSGTPGTAGIITILGGNVYAEKTSEVISGFGDVLAMHTNTSVGAGVQTYYAINSSGELYNYEATADAADKTHIWLPPKALTVIVSASGVPLAGATVAVSTDSGPLTPLPLTDMNGEIMLHSAYTGSCDITASYIGYLSGSITSDAAIVHIVLGRNTDGGGYDGGTPDAILLIRCVDEHSAVLYQQSVSAVVGRRETIIAPPLRGHALAVSETNIQEVRIVSGSNLVIFRYVAEETKIDDTQVPAGDGNPRPPVSDMVQALLETQEHLRYIHGYEDGTVRPDNNMTRAEVAVVFWRLTRDPDKGIAVSNRFADMDGSEWYAQAVNYLAGAGILTGYSDGTFQPNRSITRCEFVAMISRFAKTENTASNPFTDVSESHWAYSYVGLAYQKGWINGYPDRSFRPDSPITRGEIIKIVNYMLGRGILAQDVPEALHSLYTDLPQNHWAFAEVIEASAVHDYERQANGYEVYTSH